MVSISDFTRLALSFPHSEEQPHFHLRSFRVGKKIFCTLWTAENKAMLKLPLIEQSVFCSFGKSVFCPVPGAWGKKGATFVDLGKVGKDMLKDALAVAHGGVAPKRRKEKKG